MFTAYSIKSHFNTQNLIGPTAERGEAHVPVGFTTFASEVVVTRETFPLHFLLFLSSINKEE